MPTDDELLKPADVAVMLNASTETVRRWAEDGKLASVKLPSGHRRFRRSDIEAILEPVPASSSDEATQ